MTQVGQKTSLCNIRRLRARCQLFRVLYRLPQLDVRRGQFFLGVKQRFIRFFPLGDIAKDGGEPGFSPGNRVDFEGFARSGDVLFDMFRLTLPDVIQVLFQMGGAEIPNA